MQPVRARICGGEDIGSGQTSGRARTIDHWRDLRGRKFEDETGADGGVVFNAEKAVVFGDDAGSDGQAEAGGAVFGGGIREEELVVIGWRWRMRRCEES